MQKIKFILGIHNHQPVGNFQWVFEKGYDAAYKPFMDVMLKHKNIKWSLHCSGMLWEFFEKEHPSYITNVKKLISRGNLEILSGGYYEPLLSVIPDNDKIGQIKQLSEYIYKTFNHKPAGAWVAERVWEPSLAKILSEADLCYTVLDDVHFTSTGIDVNDLKGYYTTEEQGYKLNIFPISQKMRYFIPFHSVEDSINYFKKLYEENRETVIVMADDGEKFGMWPGTNKHVYENGWLDKFLTALDENSDIIETTTFSEVLSKVKPSGRIYLPTNSYFEMSEWTLPGNIQNKFDSLIKQHENNDDEKIFLRGGFWRGFLTKYEEANNMHKKMLSVSNKVERHKNSGKDLKTEEIQALYAGQCNCAYWHGVFGGLYLPHLRNAIYEQLLKAEELFNKSFLKKSAWRKADFDCDCTDEYIYESKTQNIYVDIKGGTIFEFDIFKRHYNLSNVLTRRYEGYHKKLTDAAANNKITDSQEVTTIHSDAVKVKELGLEKHLGYDWYRKASLVDHFFHTDTKCGEIYPVKFREQGDFVLGEYNAEIKSDALILNRKGKIWVNDLHLDIEVIKIIKPSDAEGYCVEYEIKNLSAHKIDIMFGVEQVFAFSEKTINDTAEINNAAEWTRQDENLAIDLNIKSSENCNFWIAPIETVSTSESGYERTYQGTTVINVYRFKLDIDKAFTFTLAVNVKTRKK